MGRWAASRHSSGESDESFLEGRTAFLPCRRYRHAGTPCVSTPGTSHTVNDKMNPHAAPPISPRALLASLWRHRGLIAQMARREVVGRYKGSVIGLLWSFLNPIFMLAMYTFVFSVVFKARWGAGAGDSRSEFAIVLFVGMIVHALFAEVLTRAPGLILGNVSYVKKIVFPLEVLPVVNLCAAVFHSAVSLLVLLAAFSLLNGYIFWTAVLVVPVLLPLMLLTLGLAWALASLGVFLRDVGQTIGLVLIVLMYFAPVFYPVSALPAEFRPWLMLNPITFPIEQAREVLILGHLPDWEGLLVYTIVAAVVAWGGFAWFQKTRKGFANVL
jgi:lipopolysaccharide transport system permease protein